MAPSDSPDNRGSGEGTHALVRSAATQLYAEAPAEFIATRTALVKEAKASGDKDAAKEIAGLRKPSVAAWFINQVVHTQHPVVADLADLGARLRHATSALDAAGITGMRSERDAVLADLLRAARQVGEDQGQRISTSVESEVRDTGIAALADEAAQEVFGSGTMTRALAYAGFGEVDLAEAAATTRTGVVLTSIPGGRKTSERAERAQEAPVEQDEDGGDTRSGMAEPDDEAEVAETEAADDEEPDDDDDDDGAEALAAAEEHKRRIAQAEQAVAAASQETGRRRAALDAARNRSEATRQRLQKLKGQLERAHADDDDALEKVTQAASAAKRADADLRAARSTLTELAEEGE